MTGENFMSSGGLRHLRPVPENSEIKLGDVIIIRWIDAVTQGDCNWQDLEETSEDAQSKPPEMTTVGVVLASKETHISVTDSIGEDECGHMTKIPLGMIREIRLLERITSLMSHEDMDD